MRAEFVKTLNGKTITVAAIATTTGVQVDVAFSGCYYAALLLRAGCPQVRARTTALLSPPYTPLWICELKEVATPSR